eukprot:COSAG04_NODE_264_length_18606_cov_9.965256_22_plen_231_part_00
MLPRWGAAAAAVLALLPAMLAPRPSPATAAGDVCGAGLTAVATFAYPGAQCSWTTPVDGPVVACEDMATSDGPNSTLEFHCAGEEPGTPPWLALPRRAEWNNASADGNGYGGHTLTQVLSAPDDLLGNTLLGIHGRPQRSVELSYSEVRGYAPPLKKFQNTHVFTGSREAAVDLTFDDATVSPTTTTICQYSFLKVASQLFLDNLHTPEVAGCVNNRFLRWTGSHPFHGT